MVAKMILSSAEKRNVKIVEHAVKVIVENDKE